MPFAQDDHGCPVEHGPIVVVPEPFTYMLVHAYARLAKVVIPPRGEQPARKFNMLLRETEVLDIAPVHGAARPTFTVLHHPPSQAVPRVVSYQIDLGNAAFVPAPGGQLIATAPAASCLVPLPAATGGGTVVLGGRAAQYVPSSASRGPPVKLDLEDDLVVAGWAVEPTGRVLVSTDRGKLLSVGLVREGDEDEDEDEEGTVGAGSAAMEDGGGTGSSAAASGAGAGSVAASVIGLTVDPLGTACVATSISPLGDGYYYLGSTFGDSLMVRELEEADEETGDRLAIEDNYPNLGPIQDMCLVKQPGEQEGQLVTCSGAFGDSSLRVVRHGIGVDQQAEVPLAGIRALFRARPGFRARHDRYLVLSFSDHTRTFDFVGDSMDEKPLGDLYQKQRTLYFGEMAPADLVGTDRLVVPAPVEDDDEEEGGADEDRSGFLVQVTPGGARLLSASTLKVASEWKAPAGGEVTLAAGNSTQLLLATRGNKLVLLQLGSDGKLSKASEATLPHEIACVSINPLGGTGAQSAAGGGQAAASMEDGEGEDAAGDGALVVRLRASLCVIGLWGDVTARVLKVPDLSQASMVELGGDVQPRSALTVTLGDGQDRVFVGMGDGKLHSFELDGSTGALSGGKRVGLAHQPVALARFQSGGSEHVFAACDRPTVVYSQHGGLQFASVNSGSLTQMCPFDSKSFPHCVALASETDLHIGTVESIQRLHITPVPLPGIANNITHMPASGIVAVGIDEQEVEELAVASSSGPSVGTRRPRSTASSASGGKSGDDSATDVLLYHRIRAFDDQTMEPLHVVDLDPGETVTALMAARLQDGKVLPALAEQQQPAGASGSAGGSGSSGSSSSAASSGSSGAAGSAASGSAWKEVLVVGTSYTANNEVMPPQGRLLLFESKAAGAEGEAQVAMGAGEGSGQDKVRGPRELSLLSEESTEGGIFALAVFQGRIAAGVNCYVQLFDVPEGYPGVEPGARGGDGSAAMEDGEEEEVGSKGSSSKAGASDSEEPAAKTRRVGTGAAAAAASESAKIGLPTGTVPLRCSYVFAGNTLVLFLDTVGELLVVGDMMKSVNVLSLDSATDSLVEEARDPASNWITEVKAITKDAYVCAEGGFNLFGLQRNIGALSHEDKARLDIAGHFHVGDLVTTMVPGSLVRGMDDGADGGSSASGSASAGLAAPASGAGAASASSSSATSSASSAAASAAASAGPSSLGGGALEPRVVAAQAQPRFLFGTTHGGLGVTMTIPPSLYRYLKRVEEAAEKVLSFVGEFGHAHWRGWYNEESTYAPLQQDLGSRGFVDGDMLELLLELGQDEIDKVIRAMNEASEQPQTSLHADGVTVGPATGAELVAVLEELSRKH